MYLFGSKRNHRRDYQQRTWAGQCDKIRITFVMEIQVYKIPEML
jgi:hypothetical protein